MENLQEVNGSRPLMVTIQCLTYNHEPYIRQCLEGFVMQKTNFRFEAIVHDDASTDGTATIIREYAEKYPDIIKPIYETENQYSKRDDSLTRIMNTHTHGKYVAMCEGDDYWTDPLKLQKQYEALERHPKCSICFCKVNMINKLGEPLCRSIPNDSASLPTIVTLKEYTYNEFYMGYWTFHTSSFFVRYEILQKNDEYRKHVFRDFPYGDMPLLLSALLNGYGFYISDSMSAYRVLSGGYNSSLLANPQKLLCDQGKVIQALREFDVFTNQKFHTNIERRILRGKLVISVASNNLGTFFSRKYLFIYKEWGLIRTMYMILKTISPKCASMMKNFINR